MRIGFLFLSIGLLVLPTTIGCGREPSEEERLESEFKAMPPNDDDLKDFDADKMPFANGKMKSNHAATKSGK